jgi:hypothetical protein
MGESGHSGPAPSDAVVDYLRISGLFAHFFTDQIGARITYTLATIVSVGPTTQVCRKCRPNGDLGSK